MLRQIIYRSDPIPGEAFDAGDILRVSRRNNPELGITGMLAIGDGVLTQLLEGPHTAVDALYELICDDVRHRNVRTLSDLATLYRAAPDWAMHEIGISDAELPDTELVAFLLAQSLAGRTTPADTCPQPDRTLGAVPSRSLTGSA